MASTNYEFAHIHNPAYYKDQAVGDSIKDHLDMLGVIYGDVLIKRANIEINSELTAEGKSVARKRVNNRDQGSSTRMVGPAEPPGSAD